MNIALITINQPSLDAAIRLMGHLSDHHVDLYVKEEYAYRDKPACAHHHVRPYKKLDDILPNAWQHDDAIIALLAVGAVVRKIASLLHDKSTDPAVLVMNLGLNKVVPLIGGHLGGANALAEWIASRIPGCQTFLSTATDQTRTLAFEMWAQANGWRMANLKALARISNRLINRQTVKVATYDSVFARIPDPTSLVQTDFEHCDEDTVVIAPHISTSSLTLIPKVAIGIGCNRSTPAVDIKDAYYRFLRTHSLHHEDIACIGSFEAKQDEEGLLAAAQILKLPVRFYGKDAINALSQSFSPSVSTRIFGLKGVAEPSAVLGSQFHELLFAKKTYNQSITIAGAI